MALFRNMESDRVERKRSTADRDKICQAICAFANDLPEHRKLGIIVIGQADDGRCANISIADSTLREIGGWRSDGRIQPIPTMTVQRHIIDSCEVAIVAVAPSEYPPVRFDQQTWIRVGPRRAVATFDEELRLAERRRYRNLPYDTQPVVNASLNDLDLARFEDSYLRHAVTPEVLAANKRTLADQLKALRFADSDERPTIAAILLFGRTPTAFVPGSYVQALRVSGNRLAGDAIRSERVIAGTLIEIVDGLEELLRLWNEKRVVVGGQTRKEIADYPETALRQLVRNSIIHRTYDQSNAPVRLTWYDDRIEISNPGGLFRSRNTGEFWCPRRRRLSQSDDCGGYADAGLRRSVWSWRIHRARRVPRKRQWRS